MKNQKEQIVLYKSPWKGTLIVILSIPFILAGYWICNKPNTSTNEFWLACAGVIFFSFGLFLGIYTIFDRKPYIEISKEGLKLRGITKLINWSLIEELYLVRIYRTKILSIRIPEKFELEVRKSWFGRKSLRIDKKLGFQAINFSLSPLRINSEELVMFLERLRQNSNLDSEQIFREFKKLQPKSKM